MKLLCVGGGSGGHVTPVLAVINQLAEHDSELTVLFITDKAFLSQAKALLQQTRVPVTIRTIAAGKFRRYMDVALWKQVLRPDIGGRNLVDMFKVAGGVAQSLRLLRRVKPDVVFAKGGYVSLPVGYAAHVFGVPLVIHDSDVRPGLTNRVLSRWAAAIATGTPVKNYRYNAEHATYTGVPIGSEFHAYSAAERRAAKNALGVAEDQPLIVVTGGGLGAKDINRALIRVAPLLLDRGYSVYHVTGKQPYDDVVKQLPIHPAYRVQPFVAEGMAAVYGAADIVITRASATTLQELAAAAVAAIIVPNSSLGDQLENAAEYEAAQAAVVVSDERLAAKPEELVGVIDRLIKNPHQRQQLAATIAQFARPDAAQQVAQLIMKAKKA